MNLTDICIPSHHFFFFPKPLIQLICVYYVAIFTIVSSSLLFYFLGYIQIQMVPFPFPLEL